MRITVRTKATFYRVEIRYENPARILARRFIENLWPVQSAILRTVRVIDFFFFLFS